LGILKKVIFSVITLLAVLLGLPLFAQASPLAYPIERIAGQDRVETALEISQQGWQNAQTVILSEYSDYADSIASTPFAVNLNAPILLTQGDSIDPRVIAEIKRLNPQNTILLGGNGRLRPSIEEELNQRGLTWERIGGADRYETSILLAQRLHSDSLILANGDDFPDALSAASYAGIKHIPIVLTSNTLPQSVIDYYQVTRPQHLVVIGGEGVIPSVDLAQHNFKVESRLGGQDRYETNAKVVSSMQASYTSNNFFLASGQNFPDAVAGTVLASKDKAPLLLSEKDDIPPSVYALMREHMQVEPSVQNAGSGTDTSVQIGQITAKGGLNLRDTPSATGKILLAIPEGTTIDLSAQQSQWYRTTYQSTTGWVSANYVKIASANQAVTDLTINGTVLILGGSGVISTHTENIIGGKASSTYQANLQDFSPLPAEIKKPESPSRGGTISTPPVSTTQPASSIPSVPITYDPSTEVLLDTFQGLPANALAGKKILVDPGHGGPDSGAVGPNRSFEKDNNLAISLALRDILKQAGATVLLTRDKDISPASDYSVINDLQARVDLANKNNVDLFICIHNDSFTSPDAQGTSTFYSSDNPFNNESIQLANSIQNAIIDSIQIKNRGVKEGRLYVLGNTNMPAILLETAFISNPYEEARLQNPTFQKNVASAILHGIYTYYKNPIPKS